MRRCAGYEQEEAVELMRLYQTIHADHEARRPPRCVLLAGVAAVAARKMRALGAARLGWARRRAGT